MATRRKNDAVVGDRGDTRTVVAGRVADLTGVSAVEAHVWRRGDRHVLTAEVDDPVECTVIIHLGDDVDDWLPAQATPGDWNVEIECTWPTAPPTVLTFPVGSPLTLTVRDQGDPV